MHNKHLTASIAALALCVAPLAPAQQTQQPAPPAAPQAPAAPMAPLPPMPPMPGFEPMTFNFVSSEMSFDTRTIKGAPYTAEAVTETVQTLADGNRIVRRTSAQVARDSEGRTRREATVNLIGNVTGSNDSKPSAIFINDPVAGVNYVLSERDRTARKLPSFNFDFNSAGIGNVTGFNNGAFQTQLLKRLDGAQVEDARAAARSLAGNARRTSSSVSVMENNGEPRVIITETKSGVTTARTLEGKEATAYIESLKRAGKLDTAKLSADAEKLAANSAKLGVDMSRSFENFSGLYFPNGGVVIGEMKMSPDGSKNTTTENLGKQIVEGVEAEGTRTTTTIEAGKIGNERPIVITSERWYSPELKTVVMTRRNDPRHGETTYRLTNINRSEPARSLFEVPADYTVKENSAARRIKRIETPKSNQQ